MCVTFAVNIFAKFVKRRTNMLLFWKSAHEPSFSVDQNSCGGFLGVVGWRYALIWIVNFIVSSFSATVKVDAHKATIQKYYPVLSEFHQFNISESDLNLIYSLIQYFATVYDALKLLTWLLVRFSYLPQLICILFPLYFSSTKTR